MELVIFISIALVTIHSAHASLCVSSDNGLKWSCNDISNLKEVTMNATELEFSYYNISFNKINFTKFSNLETLKVHHNKIGNINENVLTPLKKLKHLYLLDNDINSIHKDALIGLSSLESLTIANNPKLTTLPVFNKKVMHLDLHGNGIVQISTQQFQNMTALLNLDISRNMINSIADNAFIDLLNLREINLNENKISKLSLNVFAELKELRSINLSINSITKIHNNTFVHQTKLEFLNLDFNNISIIDSNGFNGLQNLFTLSLKYNGYADLSCIRLYDLNLNLTHLYLDGNTLSNIPYTYFQNFNRLKTLSLNDCKLNKTLFFGEAAINETKLAELFLSGNNIETIGDEYNNFLELTNLDLSANPIRNITALSFNGIVHLQILNISNCLLETLPDNFLANNSKMEELDLSSNKLKLPAQSKIFSRMPNLLKLYLKNNNLTYIHPTVFNTLSKLQTLMLCHNNVSFIADEPNVIALQNLQTLTLSSNKLTAIPDSFIRGMDNLVNLDLNFNLLTSINLTSASTKLQNLNLSHNQIHQISNSSLKHLENIVCLDLSCNKIQSIPFEFLKTSEHIRHVFLDGNKELSCGDCNLTLFVQSLITMRRGSPALISGTCTRNQTDIPLKSLVKSSTLFMQSSCNACLLKPCHHNGECSYAEGIGASCNCTSSFTGLICETNKSDCFHTQTCGLCQNDTCKNDGICHEVSSMMYHCACAKNYTGSQCETILDACTSWTKNPCKNNGTCTTTDRIHITCNCTSDFYGDHCEHPKPPATCHGQCQNNGTCKQNTTLKSNYLCVCSHNYTGKDCQFHVSHPCAEKPCKNDGICHPVNETSSSFTCNCDAAKFEGDRCEKNIKKKEKEKDTPGKDNSKKVGIIVGVFVVIIVLLVLCAYFYKKKHGGVSLKRQKDDEGFFRLEDDF